MRIELRAEHGDHEYEVTLECDKAVPIEALMASACVTLKAMTEATSY